MYLGPNNTIMTKFLKISKNSAFAPTFSEISWQGPPIRGIWSKIIVINRNSYLQTISMGLNVDMYWNLVCFTPPNWVTQQRCLTKVGLWTCDVADKRCRWYAISAARVVGQGRKRAFGVAKRPREISSDQARRQKAYFFRKSKRIRKT